MQFELLDSAVACVHTSKVGWELQLQLQPAHAGSVLPAPCCPRAADAIRWRGSLHAHVQRRSGICSTALALWLTSGKCTSTSAKAR